MNFKCMTPEDIAKKLLEIKAVAVNMDEPFTYTSGLRSPIYCDNRLIISYPEIRNAVADAFVDLIKEKNIEFDVIGGPATGAIPHSAWVADKLGVPMIYIRGKAKGHGKKNLVEGVLQKGQKVLILEDLISTGGSSLTAIEGVRDEGGVVTDCVAISTYEMESSKKGFTRANVNLYTLTNFSAIVNAAVETGALAEDQKEKVLEWNQDPEGWGKKMGLE